MDSRKSVRNLAQSINSLIGFKAHLTSAWVTSVCNIIRNCPAGGAPAAHLVAQRDFEKHSSVKNDAESNMDVLRIQDELALLVSYMNQLNAQRRQLLNEFLDLKGNIRVFCRIRPTVKGCDFYQLSPVVPMNSSGLLLKVSASKSKHYSFDKVFHPHSSQDEVFSEIEPIIKSVVDGYNACIFAYGQTGSGKTFTMEGTPESPGVVYRGIRALFDQMTVSNQKLIVSFSMLEIYLGRLKDLLVPPSSRVSDPARPCLSVQADPNGGMEIDNLTSIQVSDFEQALKLYRLGCQLRSTASTNLNKTSSRSHCMIRIKINSINVAERRRETNKLWMVDLGGSERVLKTKAQGRRFEEGKAINLSLSALGDVVDALQRKKCHIPYRNSKLTLVLQDCLGEDSKTLMLVHVSPEEEDLCESICSLNFATRARRIHLGNGESQDAKEHKNAAIISLQRKMEQVEDERQETRRKIQKLNKTFESFTTTSKSPSLQLAEDSQLFMEESKHGVKNVQKFPSSELPRFMQPTVCSTRKFGVDMTFFEERSTATSRRRSILHQAKSVSFSFKRNAACSSDCSDSGISCVVDLNLNSNADNETEHSQGTAECDIRTAHFQMHGKSSKCSSDREIVPQNHMPTVTSNSPMRKGVSSFPFQKGNFRISENKKDEVTEYQEEDKSDRTPSVEKNPLNFDSKSSATLCHSNGFLEEDIDCSTVDFSQVRQDFDNYNDEEWGTPMPATYNDAECLYLYQTTRSSHASQYAKNDDAIETFGDSPSIQNLKEHTETIAKGSKALFHCHLKETRQRQFSQRSQSHRALFKDELKQDKASIPIVTPRAFSHGGTGLLISVKLKIQMLYFCVLMGLGVHRPWYEDDFFHGLMH
uniref:Kinesin motor domain-containing protein n=2 Tax=Kalanchoe fedtschenkoi TaxID=63787 RepID=A0A7N0TJZ3_KALFE